MRKFGFLGIGAVALLAMPLVASAVVLEGHFSGHSDHDGSGPGDYTGATQYDAYVVLNTTQQNPWYPWNAAKEYTAVLSMPVQFYDGTTNPQTVNFGPGTISIYEDDPDANYANKATFTDGTLILTASAQNVAGSRIQIFGLPWGITGVIVFTGGPGLPLVDPQCDGGAVMNDFIDFQIVPPPATYEENYDAKWECPETTGTEPSTWGKVKGLYR